MVQVIRDQWAIAVAAVAVVAITAWLLIDGLVNGAGRRGR